MTRNKEWKKTKTIYWSDELNDDFDEMGLKRPPVPENYNYNRKHKILDWITYYLFGKPIMGLYCFFHGIRVKNRKHLRDLRKTGYFIYANHVAVADCFKYPAYCVPVKRVTVIGYSDTLSMKGVRGIAKAIGYLPIPDDIHNMRKMREAITNLVCKKKEIVLIFPEAHIWPYYTKIRNFKAVSFTYPAELNKPVVPAVTIWRGKPGKKPKQTVVFGTPIYPDPELNAMENKNYLHEQCLLQMKEIADKYPQVEYIKYIKKD